MILSWEKILFAYVRNRENLFKNSLSCCSHYNALLYFVKVLPTTDSVTYTHQRQFLLAFGAWGVLILGPVSK